MSAVYRKVLTLGFLETLQYRSEIVLWFLLDTTPTLLLFYVWQAVFAHSTQIDGYSLAQVLEYYFLFLIITNVSQAHFEKDGVEKIRDGKVDFAFLKPLSYLKYWFVYHLGNKLMDFLFVVPGLLILSLVAIRFFGLQFSAISAVQLGTFALLLISNFLIEFLMALMIVLIGFWMSHAESLEHFKWITVTLLSGSIIPLPFLPSWLRKLVQLFPFQYMYAVPIEVIQGRRSFSIFDALYLLSFITFLWLIVQTLWHFGQKKYTSAGS